MALADFLGRLGNNFQNNIGAINPQGLAQFGMSIASAPRDQWGIGLAQGLGALSQQIGQEKKKRGMAEALKGIGGQFTPEQQRFLDMLDPEQSSQIIGDKLFAAPAARWEDIGNNRQRNTATGEIKDIPLSLEDRERLAKSGASSVNVNTYPAEIGARMGVAEGFLENYDKILKDLPTLHTVSGRGQMAFNTGRPGEMVRQVKSGVDALTKQMTGAGMPVAEAQDYASRYIIGITDMPFDMESKMKGLKYDLEHIDEGIRKARGLPPADRAKTPADGGSKRIKFDASGNRVQ